MYIKKTTNYFISLFYAFFNEWSIWPYGGDYHLDNER